MSTAAFPGPLIKGSKVRSPRFLARNFTNRLIIQGDTFQLNVINELTDTSMLTSTSIVWFSCYVLMGESLTYTQHWHGLFQEGSSWADGPVGVTQCPISPSHSFLYQFSVPDQAGTFWYHSHLCGYIPSRNPSHGLRHLSSHAIL